MQIKTRFALFATALIAATAAQADPLRLCAMTPSQTAALDAAVAKLVFANMHMATRSVRLEAGDDSAPAKIANLLQTRCDVIVGVPLSDQGDKPKNTIAASYLDASFVQFRLHGAKPAASAQGQVAVAYSSPGQLIMAAAGQTNFEVENTQDQVIQAVLTGKTESGIAWRPSLIGYQAAHKSVRFELQPIQSTLSNWQVSFVADASRTDLIAGIQGALRKLDRNGQLKRLTESKLKVPFKANPDDDDDVD